MTRILAMILVAWAAWGAMYDRGRRRWWRAVANVCGRVMSGCFKGYFYARWKSLDTPRPVTFQPKSPRVLR